ncbi:MAG: hypothetical protein WAQ52_13740 [Terriglobales bacterium]
MKIEIELHNKFDREAVISFSDATIDIECSDEVQKALRADLNDLLTVFGGLTVSVIEDRLAQVPDRHAILEEILSLLERYGASKTQTQSSVVQ